MYLKNYHIHFVGIGGVGMSGIAKLLLEVGYTISGSDINKSNNTKLLQILGGIIFIGHRKKQIKGASVVVVSSAISYDNVEIIAAIAAKIPVISRAEMLAELMKQKYSIAVSGTHGKTSTTALITNLLKAANFDPSVIVGGTVNEFGSNALMGNGNFIIAEVDESDGSLLRYSPSIAVITNIDKDHLDFYKNITNIKKIFCDFINQIPFYGSAVLCLDDEEIQDIIPKINRNFITYGTNINADLKADNIIFNGMKSQFTITYLKKEEIDIVVNLPGMHNVYNAMAAIAVCVHLSIPFDIIKNTMRCISGVKRRMELKGTIRGITVLDDYGHHPTAIKATLKSLIRSWPNKRTVIVFQPHRYSRTEILFNELANSFHLSDVLIILPIYGAGEKPTGKVKSENLCSAIQTDGHPRVFYADGFVNCLDKLKTILKHKDILLTLGAGDIYKVGDAILNKIRLV